MVAKRKRRSPGSLNRRDFLALAAAGAASVVVGGAEGIGECAAIPALSGGETRLLDSGGIAVKNFEEARKRAAEMVSKLTLSEKISQFGNSAPAIPRVGLPAFSYYGSEALHGLMHSGPITSFPLPLAMGCSWNRSLIERVFTVVSDEIWAWHKKDGQSLALFSPPTVNMGTRDPRWGRIAENYSEDPYLVGQMAIFTIRGMQGNDPHYLKTIACAKHFIANDTEDDRFATSATVDPRSFWEYYTRGFEACVKGGRAFSVMSSYNAMNGIPTTANRSLLTGLLRDRWGFRGYVVSDCDAVGCICSAHHFVPTYAEAAALAVNAGCDINCGHTLQNYLGEAVDEMLISESTLDRSLVRSFTGRVLLGEFDPPEQIPYSKIPISCLDSAAHRQLALEAARQSIVLFKNENNTLPLDWNHIKKIAIIGPMADACHLGNYSGSPQFRVSPLKGITESMGIQTNPPSYQKRAVDFTQLGGRVDIQICREGGEDIAYSNDGSWTAYSNVLFTEATEFHARVASAKGGPTMEVHLDSVNGPLVCNLDIPNTGGWQNWLNVSAPISSINGEHTIYLLPRGGSGQLFNIQSFQLTPERPLVAPIQGTPQVVYALGCTVAGGKDPARFAEAIDAARKADVALVFVGCDQEVDSEGQDRIYIHLPGVQHALVKAVYAANSRTVLVISSNAPVAVNWEQDNMPAIVGGLFLGEQQGRALAEVLFGDYNPGGKLPTTWYRRIEDLPDFHDYNIRHGRTYMYYYKGDPLYPFGHGLSYTEFQYKNLRVSDTTLRPGGKITITLQLINSGSRDGDEVVQLYVGFPAAKIERPIKQLGNLCAGA